MRRKLIAFLSDRSGNFALLTAGLSIPLLLAAAYATDLATITKTKAELQQALDAGILAAAREGKEISADRAREIARTFLAANFDPSATKLKVSKDGARFEGQATTMAEIAFGGLLGYSTWPISAKSTAEVAYDSFEISLVLDTTGSMAGGKLAAMKDAVIGLIDTMSNNVGDPEKLKFAMVPFSTFVNVGPQYAPSFNAKGKMIKNTGAAWLDLKGEMEVPQLELKKGISRFEVFHNLGEDWKGCVETRVVNKKGRHDVADTVPSKKNGSLFVPAFGIDEPAEPGYANNYIASAVDPLDMSGPAKKAKLEKYGITETVVGTTPVATMTPIAIEHLSGKGPNRGCDTQPLSPLTDDYASLKSKVSSLVANGTTNIMEGVAWGNRVLSPGEPFDQGSTPGSGIEKIMIVLTDGANNFGTNGTSLGSEYSSLGYLVDGRLGFSVGGASAATDAMNSRTLEACQEAKGDGVEVYTIRLEEPDVATGTMLKECASGEDHYLDVPNRAQLDDAFDAIKGSIARVRLSS